MRTFSFVTIFSIEKCSVRLGAFGAKLRRVESLGLICNRKSDLAPKLTDHVMCNVEHTVANRLAGILEHVKRTGTVQKLQEIKLDSKLPIKMNILSIYII